MPTAPRDQDRTLSAEGREGLKQVFDENKAALSHVTQVIVSPYVRTQQTLNMALPYLRSLTESSSHTLDFLTPCGNPNLVVEWLYKHQPESCLVVSHQPLVGTLLDDLCGLEPGRYRMGTGALACIELETVAMGLGKFRWLKQAPL